MKEKKRKSVNRGRPLEQDKLGSICGKTTCVTSLACLVILVALSTQYWKDIGKGDMSLKRDDRNTTIGEPRRQSWSSWLGHTFYLSLEEIQWILGKTQKHHGIEDVHGYFPQECVWRVVPDVVSPAAAKNRSHIWRVREYEFWDNTAKMWVPRSSQPKQCTIGSRGALVSYSKAFEGKTIDHDYEEYRVLKNVWFSNGVFYKVVDAAETGEAKSLSSNIDFATLVVQDVGAFASQIKMRFVEGETVLLDFSYFIHPTAIGHWLEYLLPMMSIRRIQGLFRPPQGILLMHLKRSFVFEWVRAALGATFGIGGEGQLPPIIFQEETSSVWSQISTSFEKLPRDEWICFEKVIVAKDVIDGGTRTAFNNSRDASIFRKRMHRLYGLKVKSVSLQRDLRRKITLLHKSANRRIRNKEELKRLLSQFGTVSEFEFTSKVPMAIQLDIITKTHILVSAHTSGLANAMFLPPGALVLELRHRNFMASLENTFEQQINSLGDVTHIFWKATKEEEGPYIYSDDERKFGGELWANEKCNTEDCVEAHTLVDLVVNISEIEMLLMQQAQKL